MRMQGNAGMENERYKQNSDLEYELQHPFAWGGYLATLV